MHATFPAPNSSQIIDHISSSLMIFAYYRTGYGLGKALGSNLGRVEDVAKYVLSILE
jgi:hypothetical protein